MADVIKLTIYNAESEPIKELSQAFVPWSIMKPAMRLAKKIVEYSSLSVDDLLGDQEKFDDAFMTQVMVRVMSNLEEDDIDTLTQLVARVFDGQVTTEELERGVDVAEMVTILIRLITRFSSLRNPMSPPS